MILNGPSEVEMKSCRHLMRSFIDVLKVETRGWTDMSRRCSWDPVSVPDVNEIDFLLGDSHSLTGLVGKADRLGWGMSCQSASLFENLVLLSNFSDRNLYITLDVAFGEEPFLNHDRRSSSTIDSASMLPVELNSRGWSWEPAALLVWWGVHLKWFWIWQINYKLWILHQLHPFNCI